MSYVVAIPTYNRFDVIEHKTLKTLHDGNVSKAKIYLFVANQTERALYEQHVPKTLYREIVVGKKGIVNQRNFIANYFPEGQYVISMDDDVEQLEMLRGDKLVQLNQIHEFFVDAHKQLKREKLNLWGIYPVHNPFFMYEPSNDLRFIIGVTFGFIVRHTPKLKLNLNAETKEDYEQTIKYYKMDGGVYRFNNVTAKTKFNAPGGLGTDRFDRNKHAAEYLEKTYPDIITTFQRKNGTYEVKLKKLPNNIQ
jgi:hypothetical protein